MESILNRNDAVVSLQGSKDGGEVNLTNGKSDSEGFYVVISDAGTAGTLRVLPFNGTEAVTLPFFKGYANPMLIKQIVGDHVDNTCTGVYWFK